MPGKLAYISIIIFLYAVSLVLLTKFGSIDVAAQGKIAVAPSDRQQGGKLLPAEIGGLPAQHFIQSKSYLKVLKTSVMAHEVRLGACRTPVYQGRVEIARPNIRRAFPEAGVVPQWLEVVKIDGCEQPYNRFVLVGLVNGAPKFHPLLPGNALSSLDLIVEKDVLKTLLDFERGHAVSGGCQVEDAIRIHNTKLLSHAQRDGTVYWTEAWRISNCKEEKILTIEFQTNPNTGTDFTIHQPLKRKTPNTITQNKAKADIKRSVAQ